MASDPFSLLGSVLGPVRKAVEQIYDQTRRAGWVNVWVGQGYNPKSRPEHSSGRAVDLIVSERVGRYPSPAEKDAGDALAQWIIEQYDHDLQWVLWDQKAWNPTRRSWRQMEDRGSVSGNHRDHIHVFFKRGFGGRNVSIGSRVSKAVRDVVDRMRGRRWPVLVVDGVFGARTKRALQAWLGVRVDGVFGPQSKMALQRRLGVTVDGLFWDKSVRALQGMVGAGVDGVWGPETTRRLQEFLNREGTVG